MLAMIDSEAPPSPPDEEAVAIVLAAIDTSALANQVVDLASRIARRTWSNAQLHLLHVYHSDRYDRLGHAGVDPEELVAEAKNYLDYYVRAARRQCPAPVTGHLAKGDPADEILERARSLNADLVIVGTHDLVGLERFLLGTVAGKVAKHALCPVLTVRTKKRPYVKVRE